MADRIVIEGVKPWDGSYDFDIDDRPLTQREWGWIKRLAGYMPLTINDGWQGGDPELFAAFAVIAMHRAGRIAASDAQDMYDRFADVPFGTAIRLELDPAGLQDGDARPPAGNNSSNGSSSGDDSRTSSGMWAPADGTPASATSESAPARSAT